MSATHSLQLKAAKQASHPTSSRVYHGKQALSDTCSSPTAPIAARATPIPKTVRKFPAAARNFGIKRVPAMLVWAASAPRSGPVAAWSLDLAPTDWSKTIHKRTSASSPFRAALTARINGWRHAPPVESFIVADGKNKSLHRRRPLPTSTTAKKVLAHRTKALMN
jgi:hypothetical protein